MSGTVRSSLPERPVCCCFVPPVFAMAILFLLWKQHLFKVSCHVKIKQTCATHILEGLAELILC